MKWIVFSILVFVAGYTFITFHYRKPGQARQPYKDAKDQATLQRLQDAGYQRITAEISLPAEPQRTHARLGKDLAKHVACPGGLPAELAETLIDKPTPPESFSLLSAPASGNTLLAYSFLFTCTLPDKRSTVDETYIYLKNQDLVIVASADKIGGQLQARTRENPVLVTLPPGTLKPGAYQLRLIGAKESRQWTLQVN